MREFLLQAGSFHVPLITQSWWWWPSQKDLWENEVLSQDWDLIRNLWSWLLTSFTLSGPLLLYHIRMWAVLMVELQNPGWAAPPMGHLIRKYSGHRGGAGTWRNGCSPGSIPDLPSRGEESNERKSFEDLLYSTWNSAQSWVPSRRVWGRMDTCICMAGSLLCSPEATTTLSTGYTQYNVFLVLKKKLKKKREDLSKWGVFSGSTWNHLAEIWTVLKRNRSSKMSQN